MLFARTRACPTMVSPPAASSIWGRASARDSRVATSFLEGRRRFFVLDDDFSIFCTKEECLIVRLSFFVDENVDSSLGNVVLDVDLTEVLGPLFSIGA